MYVDVCLFAFHNFLDTGPSNKVVPVDATGARQTTNTIPPPSRAKLPPIPQKTASRTNIQPTPTVSALTLPSLNVGLSLCKSQPQNVLHLSPIIHTEHCFPRTNRPPVLVTADPRTTECQPASRTQTHAQPNTAI